jgi:hypothetical protein
MTNFNKKKEIIMCHEIMSQVFFLSKPKAITFQDDLSFEYILLSERSERVSTAFQLLKNLLFRY